jgi:endonuclease G, mitochondrial
VDILGLGLSEQRQAAARRFESRSSERQRKIEALAGPGGLATADEPQRIAKRLDRLYRYYTGEKLPAAPDLGGAMLERIINTPDFVDIRYLEAGVAAARAVGRINIRDAAGRLAGYGSASLVSPRIVLTNHHVLPTAEVASGSGIDFNYQDGLDGQPLQPRLCRFDPESLFLSDQERDFALVAVHGSEQELAGYGFNRLIEAEGKAIIGEFVTIVQHPRGEKKQVSLRENRIVDLLDSFLHYEADTEPGSSGSPVFNDQWEVVALHHASVPAPDHTELGGYMNEGIRVSRILSFARSQNFSARTRTLIDQLFNSERIVVATPSSLTGAAHPSLSTPTPAPQSYARPEAAEEGVRFSIPLEITLRVGSPTPLEPTGGARVLPSSSRFADSEAGEEQITIDPDYTKRGGYDPDFLGTGPHSVPLPILPDPLRAQVSTISGTVSEPHVLRYHHFSVVMNRERALAFFTAVNIDGRLSRRLKRERDRWFLDPRIPASEQTGEPVYVDNHLDRGHLVRRLDPAWATSEPLAKVANDDTFHFTNCTPQHKDFNHNQTTWAGLEDYILENADNRELKVSVFTGPVFADDDDEYRGVKLPRQFWKVVAMVKENGNLSVTGYALSQEALLKGLEAAEAFSYGAYRTFQVPIQRIETLTGLSFSSLQSADPLAGLEATETIRQVNSPRELVL